MFLIHAIFWLIFLYVIITTLYLVALTVGAYFFRKKEPATAMRIGIAVIVPAHNEALEIGKTVNGIKASKYPEKDFTVVVIADNC